ncbi:MAG TPA: PH domain-containing protein, partial [Longimicrobiales bacterium]
DEEVIHRGHLHKIVYLFPVIVALVFMVVATLAFGAESYPLAVAALVLALIPLLWAQILYISSEFAVTNKRVIIKVGFIQRRTLETLLTKVEGIEVHQGILARVLNFGTIAVTGTGGTREEFQNIAQPLEFRRQVQAQVTAVEAPRTHVAAGGPREERDCPHCAERILTRANVCKHCGRDVEPLKV